VPDPARAKRLAKRISTIVASAIEYEIKDPRLAGVTITDAKVTNDLHDATLFYTVLGKSLDEEPDYVGVAAALESANGVLRTRVGAAWECGSPPPWRSPVTRCPTRPTAWRSCLPGHGPRMRIWREFGRVPSTPVMLTRTV
jgi:ribosome-binding factor A